MLVVEKIYKETLADNETKYFMLRKKFLGKLDNFDTKSERDFEKKHLKAYLNNHDYFTFMGNRFKTQYGVTTIDMTEEEVKKRKEQIIELIHEGKS